MCDHSQADGDTSCVSHAWERQTAAVIVHRSPQPSLAPHYVVVYQPAHSPVEGSSSGMLSWSRPPVPATTTGLPK